jgi:hypothetical protein
MTEPSHQSTEPRLDFDIALMDSHTAAGWAYELATEDALRAALVRLDEFPPDVGVKHREYVRAALAKRFPDAA